MLTENGSLPAPMSAERRAEIARILADLGPVTRETWHQEPELITGQHGTMYFLALPEQFGFGGLLVAAIDDNHGTQADLALAEFLGETPFAVAELLAACTEQAEILECLPSLPESCPDPATWFKYHTFNWIARAKTALAENKRMRQVLKDIYAIATSPRYDACPTPAYVQAIGDLAQPFLVEEDSNAT